MIVLRERLKHTCKLAHDNLKRVQVKQKASDDVRIRSGKFDNADKVLLLLPSDNNRLLLHWKYPYEKDEVVNRKYYKVDVNGVVNMYHAKMLKQ